MPTLSVIIIAKNEAADIRQCLESVRSTANEIIVLDSGSTDGTQAICREYTDKVFDTDWPGFGPQKNRALAKATGDWILSLDADEFLSDALREEITKAILANEYDGYTLPFHIYFCGKLIKHGSWHTRHCERLFKRGHGKFTDVIVHERLVVDGRLGNLKNPAFHYTYKNLEEALEKLNRYSTDGAQEYFKRGKKGSLKKALWHASWAFFRSYILQRGFLDGGAGIMQAISSAEYCYYRYLKLKFLSSPKHS